MRILVTGSAGHLGEGLVRTLLDRRHEVIAVDIQASPFTTHVGSVANGDLLRRWMRGVDAVVHTAALHKRHLSTHSPQEFIETNIRGTLAVLESAVAEGVSRVVLTSTTSTFGTAMRPIKGGAAILVDERLQCIPKNIYGMTKKAAEDLCEMYFNSRGLPCIVLRVGRFYPETDEVDGRWDVHGDLNRKVNDFLYRRVDLADAVDAHLLAVEHVREIGFGRYVVSATSPFGSLDLARLQADAPGLVRDLFPDSERIYRQNGWQFPSEIDRVYINNKAREELGWCPRIDFRHLLNCLLRGEELFSPLARLVGSKGYGVRACSTDRSP